ncbi:MAG: hypothetical protein ACOCP8_07715 [archaeon]
MIEYVFKYEDIDDLSKTERKILLILGDNYKLPPLILDNMRIRVKDKNKLYNNFFADNISKNEFDNIIEKLFLKGLVEFSDFPDGRKTTNEEFKKRLAEAKKDAEKIEKNNNIYPIRLTGANDTSGITGDEVYEIIKKNETQKNINEMATKVGEIKNSLNNFYTKIIELLGIFIAIFSLIVGNISLINWVEDRNIYEIISYILLINGTITSILLFLFLLIENFIYNRKLGVKLLWFIFPLILILIGLIITLIS